MEESVYELIVLYMRAYPTPDNMGGALPIIWEPHPDNMGAASRNYAPPPPSWLWGYYSKQQSLYSDEGYSKDRISFSGSCIR